MNVSPSYAVALIAVCAGITLLERAFPFLIFRRREVPPSVRYLGRVLPMAIISVLIVYCLKDVSFAADGDALPRLAACAVTILLHLWKKNTLLSIFGGTAVCVALTALL